ncbi:hypothetical protein ABZ636_31290 [Streptomyces sp. NPDC007251]|uniref:hypothetical protein n=1 Tax=Streptomyces sp. NPDC007251 TaxID=3154483 RepID=UPI0033C48208
MTTTAMTHVLERDARTLLAEYDAGLWRPTVGEQLLAEGLARSQWGGTVFRAALRDVADDIRDGRLVDVLGPATSLLEAVDASAARPALLALRQLVDALAAGEGPVLDQDGEFR